jgi:hypothetical protein
MLRNYVVLLYCHGFIKGLQGIGFHFVRVCGADFLVNGHAGHLLQRFKASVSIHVVHSLCATEAISCCPTENSRHQEA